MGQDAQPSLGDLARAARHEKANQPASRPEVKALVDQFNAEHAESDGGVQPSINVKQLLAEQRFDDLDNAAEAARSHKTREPGGVWQLFLIYEAINDAARADSEVIEQLQKWAEARPQSITARIALADAYVTLGFKARGKGFADAVTDAAWQGLADNSDRAVATLKQLSNGGRDPHVYYVLMQLALARGWDNQTTRQIFEQALAAEPGYYHTFRQYANYLAPKWYGEGEDAEQLAEELSRRVGGKEGLFLYFEVATVVGCDCDNAPKLEHMSWPKVKNGYAALEELYGTTNRDNNRFALLAVAHGDKPAAQAVFHKIAAFDHDVWSSQSTFETVKAWALQP